MQQVTEEMIAAGRAVASGVDDTAFERIYLAMRSKDHSIAVDDVERAYREGYAEGNNHPQHSCILPDENKAWEESKARAALVRSKLEGANGQAVKPVWIDGKHVEVDAEIAALVAALNSCGFGTVASCSGHGHRPANIALADGREIIIARDFDEARRIDALFPLDINGSPIGEDVREEWSMWRSPKYDWETYDAAGIQCLRYPAPMDTDAEHGCGEYRASLDRQGK